MNRKIILIPAALAVALLTVCGMVAVKNSDQTYRSLFDRHMRVIPPETPGQASFAGEEAPLDLYYVREALEREIMAGTFMHSNTVMVLKRAHRMFPVIEPILKRNGVPDDFKFLAVAESNLLNVTSPAGAEGYWQFMEAAGKKHGLEINDRVDERYNLEKATQAACEYLLEARQKFGSWTLAAAAYNRGPDGLQRAIDSQKATNYYDLYLNDETARYVYRIMAIKEIWNKPVRYGFLLREQDLYPVIPTRQVSVDSAIADLPAFARSQGTTYRVLRELNPWIHHYNLPNKDNKTYVFRFPQEGALSMKNLMQSIPSGETFYHDTLRINEIH